ncbi:MAG: hypothetical protein L3J71_12525 [Victivallaceae bacterium]|nr:hypothetical protein [Victivallaceae bacterium]
MTMDENFINIVKKKNMLNMVKVQTKQKNSKLWETRFDTYIQATLIKNMQRAVVLPVYQKDADYNIQLIKKIKAKYKLKFYWELGNELQFYEYRFNLNKNYPWNEKIYARRFMKIAEFIRQNYPQDKIGLLLTGSFGENQLTPIPDKIFKMIKPWNKELLKEKYLPYYDGIIVHPYVVPKSTSEWKKFLKLKNNESAKNIENIKLRRIFALVQNGPEDKVRYFEKLLAGGKKIYITESGLLSHAKNNIKNLNQSIVGVVFNIAYFISWMNYSDDIGIYMRHLLAAGNGIQAIYKDYSWNAVTISWNILKLARENVRTISSVVIKNSPVYYGIGKIANKSANIEVKALTALYLKGNKEKILIANTSNRRIKLKLPFGKSKIIYASDKEKKHIAIGTVHKLSDYAKIKKITSREWIMPAFSVALIIADL